MNEIIKLAQEIADEQFKGSGISVTAKQNNYSLGISFHLKKGKNTSRKFVGVLDLLDDPEKYIIERTPAYHKFLDSSEGQEYLDLVGSLNEIEQFSSEEKEKFFVIGSRTPEEIQTRSKDKMNQAVAAIKDEAIKFFNKK